MFCLTDCLSFYPLGVAFTDLPVSTHDKVSLNFL